MRLDQWLVKNQKVRSRTQAEELIKRGEVSILDPKTSEWQAVQKPSFEVNDEFDPEHLKISSVLLDYVARSGYKLEKALEHLKIRLTGFNCLDVGQSTGGFSQALLEKGALTVVGLDVGSNQLSEDLRKYNNLFCFENLDIRKAKDNPDLVAHTPFDLAVVDVSFISLTQVLDYIVPLLKVGAQGLALVKPQFELTARDLDKKGLVKSTDKYLEVETKIRNHLKELKLQCLDYFKSELEGKDGNTEFFVHFKI